MYTAIQAKNISEEKRNHQYYKLYKRRVDAIMFQLNRAINQGKRKMNYLAKDGSRMEQAVLNQIAYELHQVGYYAMLKEEKLPDGWKNYILEIKWGIKGTKNDSKSRG